jgi:predicted dehydrogenase
MSVRIGIVGIGFMGMTHFEGAKKVEGAHVGAIATRDPKKLAGDWSTIQGNFGPRGSNRTELGGVKKFSDYREMLKDPDIDLVDVCLPTDQHEKIVLEALAAGKHVLVEKPIAIELAAGQRMVESARKANRLLMVGQVLPFFPEFRWTADVIKSGMYGKLRAASFRRIIAPPAWSTDMSDFRKLGGWGIDLHIHDNHYIGLVCGVPKKVYSRGVLREGLVNHVCTQYVFDDPGLTVSSISGGIAAAGLKFAHGFNVILEEATIEYDAGTYGSDWVVNRPLTLVTNDGNVSTPNPGGGGEWCAAFTEELQAAVNAVETGDESPVLSGQLALAALKVCHAEAESIRTAAAVEIG